VGTFTRDQPCYSARLIQPFIQLLSSYPSFPVKLLDDLKKLDIDARFPIAETHELLRGAIAMTGDDNLGLKAGRLMAMGDGGALDYAMSSAATFRDAVETASRYSRLVNDALELKLEVRDGHAFIRLESQTLLPRAAEDFMIGSFFANPVGKLLPGLPNVECWFQHGEPQDTSEYQRTFGSMPVRFAAPCSCFVLAEDLLATPLASADAKLHTLISRHADQTLSEIPSTRSLTDKVRQLLAKELAQGHPTATQIAHKLHTSPRTLARKLEAEGTTFTDLLDDLRRRLALQYLGSRDVALSELTFLLGFSHTAAFHRAFKRWTGQTPLEYRRSRGR
jgi:AraC-like DNA-binding protein